MSKSNIFETGILKLLFQNVASDACIAAIGSGLQASATAGSLYISLHTANPDEAAASGQQTSESAYTNYARQAVARSSGGWTVSGNNCSNAAAITFPQCGATGSTVTHFGIGTASTGAGYLLFWGTLTAQLVISSGITPEFAIGDLDINED